MRRSLIGVAALAVIVGSSCSASAGGQHVTLTLDWTPNPDHVGFYYARETGLFERAGLDVAIHAPSDPTAPLKLVGVGDSDLAVSYEQEVFLAAAKQLPVTAVAAVVPRPLNSLIAIEPECGSCATCAAGRSGSPACPRTTRRSIPRSLGRPDAQGRQDRQRRLQPAPRAARPQGRRRTRRVPQRRRDPARRARPAPDGHPGQPRRRPDATTSSCSSQARSGSRPTRPTARPSADSSAAFLAGTSTRAATPSARSRSSPRSPPPTRSSSPARRPPHCALLAGPDGVGCLQRREWQRFGTWMHARGLLKTRIPAASHRRH